MWEVVVLNSPAGDVEPILRVFKAHMFVTLSAIGGYILSPFDAATPERLQPAASTAASRQHCTSDPFLILFSTPKPASWTLTEEHQKAR